MSGRAVALTIAAARGTMPMMFISAAPAERSHAYVGVLTAGASDRDRVLMMMVRTIPVIPMKQDDAGDDVRSDGGLRLAYVR